MATVPPQPLHGASVLIAEDDALVALDVERALRRAGAEIAGLATTLQTALALAKSAPLTCAVLDINLGFDLVFPAAQVLRDRGIGFIFHTGIDDPGSLERDWPGVPVLSKPVLDRLLIEAVHGCL
jgi:CheY-like chemotaxis protein